MKRVGEKKQSMFFDHPTIASLTCVGLLHPPPLLQDHALRGFVQSLREHNEAAKGKGAGTAREKPCCANVGLDVQGESVQTWCQWLQVEPRASAVM